MPAIDTLFSYEMMQVLCRIFLHSLWQGMIAAALAGIVLLFTKRSTATLRYNLLLCIFIVFVAATIVTAVLEINKIDSSEQAGNATINYPAPVVFITKQESIAAQPVSLIQNIQYFCDRNASLILVAWSLLFLYKCSRLSLGLAQIRRLRREKTKTPSEHWKQKAEQLKQQLGIHQTVTLLESGLVNVPIAIGYLKPLILLPIGFLSHLSPQQVETILIHELAHIRRKDYIVNLFQNVVETVFYFNPALLWISSLLRQEREACCDDAVMTYTNDRSNYVEALVAFQEYNMPHALAMGIGNKKMFLLQRVKRLLIRENQNLCTRERITLLAGIMVFVLFTLTSFKQIIPKKETAPVSSKKLLNDDQQILQAYTVAYSDTPKLKTKTSKYQFKEIQIDKTDPAALKISTTDQFGNSYRVEDKKDNKPMFFINGAEKPIEELRRYEKLFTTYKIAKSIPAPPTGKLATPPSMGKPAREADPCIDADPPAINEFHIDKRYDLALDIDLDFKVDPKQWEFDLKKREIEFKKKEIEFKKLEMEKLDLKLQYNLKKKIRVEPARIKNREFNVRKDTSRTIKNTVPPVNKIKPPMPDPAISKVKQELVNNDVVKAEWEIESFALTAKALVVNGRKQTDLMHRRILRQVDLNSRRLYYGPGS